MSAKKQGKKQHKTKAERLDEFLYDEDENFDEEDADRVTDDTLEFLSLDDETINRYQSKQKAGTTSKKKKPAVKYRREDEYEDEDYGDEDYEDEDYEDEDYEDEDYEDDDYEDEDYEDEDYEDEDYEDDDYEERRGVARFIKNISALDVIVVLLGIVVLAGACVTGGIYANAKVVEKQVEAFATLGEEMEGITVIGEGGLVAVSESAKLANMIGYESEPEQQWTEDGSSPVQETNKKIEVGLNITSIQSDMKLKFVNKSTGKLIGGVPFEVSVSGNKNYDLKDDDKDGIIYETGVASGTYSVTVKPLAGELAEKYTLPASASSVTVTDKIAYKKVEVADEIKTEAEVNVAAEDTEIQITTESTLTDTVEWVESTKTPVNSDDNYKEVNRADVPDPATLSLGNAVFMKFVSEGETSASSTTTETSTSSTTTETSTSSTTTETSTSSTTTETSTSSTTTETSTSSTTTETSTSSTTTETPVTPATPTYSVSVSPAEITVGETASLSVSGDGYQFVSWSSDSSAITINSNTVTGISEGTATITATVTASDGNTQTLSCTVTVKAAAVVDPPKEPTAQEKLNALAPSLSNFTMKKGESTTISVGVKTTQYPYKTSWSSNTASVATIDSNGTVKAVGSGQATISAVVEVDGVTTTVSCIVTVQDTAPVYTLSNITGTTTIQIGGTSQLSVTVTPAGGKVTWSSSDKKIVTVDANGKVTGVAAGSAKITATCGGAVKECTVTVTNIKYQITITGNNTVQVGKSDVSLKATVTPAGGKVTWSSDNTKILTVDSGTGAMKGVAVGTANVIATCGDSKATFKVTVKNDRSDDTKTKLKDKNGNQLFVKKDGKYVEAVYADYYTGVKLYLQKTQNYTYTGWQTIDGYTYFFDKNGKYVTGDQVIQGARYSFGSDGKMSTGSGSMGIDVSKHNGAIDWNAVKNSGISFVIIRCGYRGSATGALIEDPIFRSNIQGAKAAGLKVGIYVYSQAVNEVEAVEEASMAVSLAGGYGLNYPIFIDVEASGGRGDSIGRDTRTAVCKAFCNTVQNSGYAAGIYSNKNWLSEQINTGSLTNYKIWLAQYAGTPTYTTTKYDMWQYSSKGKVSGISGNVDMNISYLNY